MIKGEKISKDRIVVNILLFKVCIVWWFNLFRVIIKCYWLFFNIIKDKFFYYFFNNK